jgi:glucose/arabinose dehydrogenase
MRTLLVLVAAAAMLWPDPTRAAEPARLELQPGDHICIIGNALAERMQHDGWLETLLHARFPDHNLVIRNLAVGGDTVTMRLRSMDFGTPDQWLAGSAPIPQPHKLPAGAVVRENRFELTDTKADVIFAFFGFGESFADEAGLEQFKKDLDAWIKHALSQKYNGKSAPRLVLFSPIAHEDMEDPNLPDGKANNANLELYTQAMREVSQANRIVFVDLFEPTADLFSRSPTRLTINGIHLTERGNAGVASIIVGTLFGNPTGGPAGLYEAVLDKNFHWFHRYRTTDGYSTYGDRAFLTFIRTYPRSVDPSQVKDASKILPSNYEVLQRELEVLDVMTSNRDRAIWAATQGKAVEADDSNVPPLLATPTNHHGPNPDGSHPFLGAQEAIAKIKTAPGFRVNLYATEEKFPELINPVQMAWDTRGRLWVAVWPTYPHWKPVPGTRPNDKLLIFEDTDGDGAADICKTFAGDLHNPTGFEFYNGGVIVAQGPDMLFLKDTDGDDQYDVKERILHGLDTADTHHTANSFTFDPGGALYFQQGIFMQSNVETPYGVTRLNEGGVFRYEPRTHKLSVYVAMIFPPFANPHGHVFTRWGQEIIQDGTTAVPYLGASASVHIQFPHRHPAAPAIYTQRIRPCPGTEILSSRHFPESMQGDLLVGNVIGLHGILRYKLNEKGSGLEGVEQEVVLQSSDTNFRPSDFEIGPDGALYFTDWHNPIIGHMQHNLRDPNRDSTHGRVYRLTYEGRDLLKPAKIAGQPIEQLLDLLKEPEDRVRYRAKIELSNRDSSQVISALRQWIERLDSQSPDYEHQMMEALWLHQWHNVVDAALLKRMLRSPEPHARAAATRVLCYWRDRIPQTLELLATQVADEHPRVRLEAVRTCSFLGTPRAAEIALEAANHPLDKFLEYALDQTLKTLERQTQ